MPFYSFDVSRLIEICRAYGVRRAGVFGSFARGEATDNSDLDILVEFAAPVSLLLTIRLQRELADALGREVDLTTEAGLSPYIRTQVLREIDWLFEDEQTDS